MATKSRSSDMATKISATPRSGARRNAEGPPKDPWELYHLVLAIVVIAGVIASCHGLLDLLQRLHRMSELEQSGLGAAFVVTVRGLARLLHQPLIIVAKAIVWITRRRF